MFSKKSKDKSPPPSTSQALVRQDPRTKVQTTSAESETTNTSVKNATIFDNNTSTVTFQTTRQTVTHHQQARITEMVIRRTPTPEELEEMLRALSMSKTEANNNNNNNNGAKRKSGNFGANNFKTNRISPKSATKFKTTTASPISRLAFNYDSPYTSASTSSPSSSTAAGGKSSGPISPITPITPITPTLVKTQQTTVTQKTGRTVTSHTEQHRVKIDPMNLFDLSTPKSTYQKSKNFTTSKSMMEDGGGAPYRAVIPASLFGDASLTEPGKPTSYTSPYNKRTIYVTATPTIHSSTVRPPPATISAGTAATWRTTPTVYNGAKPKTVLGPSNSMYSTKLNSSTPASAASSVPKMNLKSTISPFAREFERSSNPTYSTKLNSSSSSPSSSSSSAPKTNFKSTVSPFAREFERSSNPSKLTTLKSSSAVKTPAANIAACKKNPQNLKPGYAYIFNNETFDDPKNKFRDGSSEDVKALTKTLESFNVKVTVISNPKLSKIKSTVQQIETKDFTKHSCLVIAIFSHGMRHEEVCAKDGTYSIDDQILYPILRNRTLNDKPKMFFIQACKGNMESGKFQTDGVQPFGSPNEILKCYSTFEGYVSYRSKEGSIFIQSLCECLGEFGQVKNIEEIMKMVTLIVKQQSQSVQIPTVTSTLTVPYIFGDYIS